MISSGQKLKMPKTCEKPSYKIIRVVLCKKPFEKTPNIPAKATNLKVDHLPKAVAHANAIALSLIHI